jgi:hypothetical protein
MVEQLFEGINSVLQRHGVPCKASAATLSVTEKTVTDIGHEDTALSLAVIDRVWPIIRDIEAYHYTTAESAESILRSTAWRLYALRKRFHEGEIVDFCKAHGLRGYLETDANGEPVYKNLNMANMFYASYTPVSVPPDADDYLWNVFSKGTGVRFKLRLRAANPNLRQIHYPTKAGEPIRVLAELQECARLFGKEFVLAGISRLCAFYLQAGLRIEHEVRVLYRKWPGFGPEIMYDGSHEYIIVPLGQDSPTGFRIDIVELQAADPARFGGYGVSVVSR